MLLSSAERALRCSRSAGTGSPERSRILATSSSFRGPATISGFTFRSLYTSSVAFCADLLEQQGLIVTPGVGYGPSGETFFRLSMTSPDERIDEAMERLRAFSKERL